MKYAHIENMVKDEYKRYFENHKRYILEGNEDRVKAYSTKTRFAQYEAGKISLDKLKEFAIARKAKAFEKEEAEKIEFLKAVENAGTVESITIRVEWKRNKYWGNNPHAYVDIYGSNGVAYAEDMASGCGYDKRSAAVGGALNKLVEMRKILCDMKETALVNKIDNGNESSTSNERFIEYGAGYGAIPYFEGGVGYECFDRIFKKAGFKCVVHDESARHSDYYYYTRETNE